MSETLLVSRRIWLASTEKIWRETLGKRSMIAKKSSRFRLSVIVCSIATTSAERGRSSNSASSPKNSPGPITASSASCPCSETETIFTRPDSITHSARPGSPSWKITSPSPKRRRRTLPAIASTTAGGRLANSGTVVNARTV